MKYFVFLLTILFVFKIPVQAIGIDYSIYYDKGAIYSGTTFIQSVSKQNNDNTPDLNTLKQGTASVTNIFGLIEMGNASIDLAAKNGGITKIYYIDTKVNKVYLPLLFIPIYAKEIKTIVYGE